MRRCARDGPACAGWAGVRGMGRVAGYAWVGGMPGMGLAECGMRGMRGIGGCAG
ncbi:hypothetical protein JOD63_002996 [Microbacterium terrae]|uniref:Uncharacterized protein n=1 Tax=Microbacterium terrae TaxID=69369 RepID=A0A0M2HD33_9MICO|nr:hypothetical protein RS81_01100 [Microbacterium terrae]MBP1079028.1 hypothetical protein [Microbacterium terrae]GLJ98428.1 hypothetical protein GCM10017594_16250 [Microbacterium terrae]